jgi:hypothetical protein
MKNNYYDKITQSNETRLAMGNDVKSSGLLRRFTSTVLWQNSRINQFLTYLDSILIHLIDTIKTVQFLNNFTITKHDKRYNQ